MGNKENDTFVLPNIALLVGYYKNTTFLFDLNYNSIDMVYFALLKWLDPIFIFLPVKYLLYLHR